MPGASQLLTPLLLPTYSSHLYSWLGAPKLTLPPGTGNPRYATVAMIVNKHKAVFRLSKT